MASRQHVNMMSGQSGQMAGRPGQQVGRSGPLQRVVHGGPQNSAVGQLRKQRDGKQQQVQQQRVVQAENQVQSCVSLKLSSAYVLINIKYKQVLQSCFV